jgi:hypothetical protein
VLLQKRNGLIVAVSFKMQYINCTCAISDCVGLHWNGSSCCVVPKCLITVHFDQPRGLVVRVSDY